MNIEDYLTLPTLQNRILPAFPCWTSKSPMSPRGYQDATTDPKTIFKYAKDSPFLLGVPTGEMTDFDVLDIDLKAIGTNSYVGQNRIHILNGIQLPPTREHFTRSGGLHLLFAHHPELRCSASKLAPGVDVRADGGYIIWWPREGFEVRNDSLLAPWPTEILDALASTRKKTSFMVTSADNSKTLPTKKEKLTKRRCLDLLATDKELEEIIEEIENRMDFERPAEVTTARILVVLPYSRESVYSAQACVNAMFRLKNTETGRRNTVLNAEAYSLGRILVRHWISPRLIISALLKGALGCNLIMDDGFEAAIRTIVSGLSAGIDNPYPDLEYRNPKGELD